MFRPWPLILIAVASGFVPGPGFAATVRVDIGAVEGPVAARSVTLELRDPPEAGVSLHASARDVRVPGMSLLPAIEIDCGQYEWTADQIACTAGKLGVSSVGKVPLSSGFELRYRRSDGAFSISAADLAIAGGRANLSAAGKLAEWQGTLRGRGLAVAELRKLLEPTGFWPAAMKDEAGTLDVDATATLGNGGVQRLDLDLKPHGLGFGGPVLADGVEGSLKVKAEPRGTSLSVSAQGELTAGALYVEPGVTIEGVNAGFTFEPTAEPLTVKVDATRSANGEWQLRSAALDEPGVLRVSGNGEISPAAPSPIKSLRLTIEHADLPAIYAGHVKPLCVHLPALCGLELTGQITGQVELDEAGLASLDLHLNEVYLDDARRRFRLSNLDGNLAVSADAEPRASNLRWQGGAVYRLNFGPGAVTLSSRDRRVSVTDWTDVEILGGSLQIDALEVRDVGRENFCVTVEGALTPVPMEDFSQAMGWPIMSGKLSAVIPLLTYCRGGNLTLDGDILMRLFNGSVVFRGLRIESLFRAKPILTTDIDIRDIDLEQATGAFSFGKIEGRLQGAVHKLRMENWEPKYFEAHLETPPGDNSRHRISQKAVDNLSAIGSGGVRGALSRGFLGIFKEYSYDRLGLSCRLQDGICTLDGVAPAPEGFYIVTRGGLLPPWVEVIGTGRSVPWTDLVYGLKRISKGDMEVK